jgi:hypothetical protein
VNKSTIAATVLPMFLIIIIMYFVTFLAARLFIMLQYLSIPKHNALYCLLLSINSIISIWVGMLLVNYTPLFDLQNMIMKMYLIIPFFIFFPLAILLNKHFGVRMPHVFFKYLYIAFSYIINIFIFIKCLNLWHRYV